MFSPETEWLRDLPQERYVLQARQSLLDQMSELYLPHEIGISDLSLLQSPDKFQLELCVSFQEETRSAIATLDAFFEWDNDWCDCDIEAALDAFNNTHLLDRNILANHLIRTAYDECLALTEEDAEPDWQRFTICEDTLKNLYFHMQEGTLPT